MQIKKSSFIFFLYPLTPIYWVIVTLRNLAYDFNIIKKNKLNCPVISVGNITSGGSGKTPMVIFLSKILIKKGLKVGILTRGFGRKSKKNIIISNEGNKELNKLKAYNLGDEPLLIYRTLKNTPIAIGKDRFKSGKVLLKKYKLDVILLDDGFQHRSLHRDLEIVLINSLDKKKDHHLLPIGTLREPFFNLKRSDLIVLTKNNISGSNKLLKEKIFKYQLMLFTSIVKNQLPKKRESLELIKNKNGYLLSGIADPLSFELTIKKITKKIIGHLKFQDHYNYSQKDLEKIEKKIKNKGADYIITTEKDWVKINNLKPSLPIIPLRLIFDIEGIGNQLKFQNLIFSKIKFETYHTQTQPLQKLT